jgi:hypothetical protein
MAITSLSYVMWVHGAWHGLRLGARDPRGNIVVLVLNKVTILC